MSTERSPVKIYASWSPGLTDNHEALAILKKAGLGLEMSNTDKAFENVRDAGLPISLHCIPTLLNPADPNYLSPFAEEQGRRLLQVIRQSDTSGLGIHGAYSARKVTKMKAAANIPEPGTVIIDPQYLAYIIASGVVGLHNIINDGIEPAYRKRILIESMDTGRGKPIDWSMQTPEVQARQSELQAVVEKYGVNAGQMYITEPFFIKSLFALLDVGAISPSPMFIFDIAHKLISADGRIHEGKYQGSIDDYFNEMLQIVGNRTSELHLTVPGGSLEEGFADHHRPFVEGDKNSDLILRLARKVYERTPNVEAITLEFGVKGNTPIEHANLMVEQAKLINAKLKLGL